MIVTCEHGGNEVPERYADCFASPGASAALRSHRGYDPGALAAARYLTGTFSAAGLYSCTTRLLIDLNRSEDNPELWSRYSNRLDASAKNDVLETYYRPYRRQVYATAGGVIDREELAFHLSVHTFTPRFRGTRRNVDIGILFDPSRRIEAQIANRWCVELQRRLPRRRVAANQPYLGTDDGLTTWMRSQFSEDRYVGIEIEIANSIAKRSVASQHRLFKIICDALNEIRCDLAQRLTPKSF